MLVTVRGGDDEFAVVEGIFGRRFSIHPENTTEIKPTDRTCQIQYKIHAGEPGWLLEPDKAIEF